MFSYFSVFCGACFLLATAICEIGNLLTNSLADAISYSVMPECMCRVLELSDLHAAYYFIALFLKIKFCTENIYRENLLLLDEGEEHNMSKTESNALYSSTSERV